jgi:hypothetical protein
MTNNVSFSISRPNPDFIADAQSMGLKILGAPPERARVFEAHGTTVAVRPRERDSTAVLYWLQCNELLATDDEWGRKRVSRGVQEPLPAPPSLEKSVIVGAYRLDYLSYLHANPESWLRSVIRAAERRLDGKKAWGDQLTVVQRPQPLSADELYLSAGSTQLWLTPAELDRIRGSNPAQYNEIQRLLTR